MAMLSPRGDGLILLLIAIVVWFSLKAKPIGTLPYRYGTFVGIVYGLTAAVLLISTIKGLPNSVFGRSRPLMYMSGQALGALSVSGVLISISVGLLRRRRFGVIIFFVLQGLGLIFFLAAGWTTQPVQFAADLVVYVVFLYATSTYFANRWKFMIAADTTAAESATGDIPAAEDKEPPAPEVDQDGIVTVKETLTSSRLGNDPETPAAVCVGCGLQLESDWQHCPRCGTKGRAATV
jgi:hypothetical protein